MKIINRKKFIRGLLILIGLISLFACKSTFSFSTPNYKKVYVTNNETLWEIAQDEAINNNYYRGKDIRAIVDSIKNINNLKESTLYEGQELLIAIQNN